MGLEGFFTNCIVLLYKEEEVGSALMLSEMPTHSHVPGIPPVALFPVCESHSEYIGYIQQITADSGPIHLREVICDPVTAVDKINEQGELPELSIQRLAPYGASSRPQPSLKPVAIVAVRCAAPQGRDLILKRRTRLTDSDDFDKLSLFSSRVQESDVAAVYNTSISPSAMDDETALDDLWIAAKSPERLGLSRHAFLLAAKRELSISCGLEVAERRLLWRGFQVVQREGSEEQLGFAVFALDLLRNTDVDEVKHVIERNPDGLVRVRIGELYGGKHELNRLLLSRREWLEEHCFEVDRNEEDA
jgi:hypothetical protein